jgi:hypothetical protein
LEFPPFRLDHAAAQWASTPSAPRSNPKIFSILPIENPVSRYRWDMVVFADGPPDAVEDFERLPAGKAELTESCNGGDEKLRRSSFGVANTRRSLSLY